MLIVKSAMSIAVMVLAGVSSQFVFSNNSLAQESPKAGPTVAESKGKSPCEQDRVRKERALGKFYFLRGNYAAAFAHYRGALGFCSDDPVALYGVAESLDKAGKKAEATQAYKAYLDLYPKGDFAEEARKAIDRLETQKAP